MTAIPIERTRMRVGTKRRQQQDQGESGAPGDDLLALGRWDDPKPLI
jgi:hypothetical protein